MKKPETNSINLTAPYFQLLLENIKQTFKNKHQLKELPRSMQFFGYGNFDSNKPNLKADLEHIGNDFINGKYLYDKAREFYKGKQVIQINQYYKASIFVYLGYENFAVFLENNKLDTEKENAQKALLGQKDDNKSYYYLNHYFGEDNIIQKGKSIISDNWKKIKNIYVYSQEDGSFKEFNDIGTITKREDSLQIRNKTILDGKLVEGASEIFYIGQNEPSHLKFLIGTYITFDIYNNTVAGRCILEKCESEAELNRKFKDPKVPAYIAMEIRNKRIVNRALVPKNALEISKRSPYAAIYENLPGIYDLTFHSSDETQTHFRFKITANNFQIIPLDENVYIEKNTFELINRGSILYFNFNLSGIVNFNQLNIYFKTYFLKENGEIQNGVYSGINNENRLINGTVDISFLKEIIA